MKPCQIKTDNKDVFLCKKMGEKTSSTFQKIHTRDCNVCQKDEDKNFPQIEFGFYMNAFINKDFEDNIIDIKNFLIRNKTKVIPQFERQVATTALAVGIALDPRSKEIIEKIKDIGFEELQHLFNNEEEAYKIYKNKILAGIDKQQEQVEKSISQQLSLLRVRKDIIQRLIKEEKDKFSTEFLSDIDKVYADYDENITEKQSNSDYRPVQKISIVDRLKNAKEAFKRVKESGINNKETYVSEQEVIERQVACSQCTKGGTCPFCGCGIKKSWFLPIGKSELATEGCPNPTTYPNIKNYPRKNFWEDAKHELLVVVDKRKIEGVFNYVEELKRQATGKIKIIISTEIPKNDHTHVLLISKKEDVEFGWDTIYKHRQ